jgi:RimJ/RimL family protein N-acetyltransferase
MGLIILRVEILNTARLTLRPLMVSDLDALCELYADPQVMAYVTGRPRSRAETAKRLETNVEQHRQYGFGLCATLWRETATFIGRCGLEPRIEPDGTAGELAWMFTREWWGKGLGLEVSQALLRYAIDHLRLCRVFATADHRNVASIAIMKRLGMRLVDTTDRGVEYEVRSA